MRKKCLILIVACSLILMDSCTIYRKEIGILNEKIAIAQCHSFPEYRVQRKQWERVLKKQGEDFCKKCVKIENFRMYRDSSDFFKNIKQNDTIYMIEHLSEPYNNYFLIIWDYVDTACFYGISVERTLNKISYNAQTSTFSKCDIKLVGQWDIKGIRKEERKYPKYTESMGFNYATRIIIKKNKYIIDCIRFYLLYLPCSSETVK